MKKKSKLITVILTLAMIVGMTSGAFAATGADDAAANEAVWEVSKSKTATNLDENFESQVTLSLPAAEEQLVSDVVFVLDKSTSVDVENAALGMLADLQKQVKNTNAKVKVGVVIFNKIANVTGFKDLEREYDDIEKAIKQEINSGTNTHAGLLAGKQLLDDDTSVAAARKYMIFVSDGITYMFNETPTAVAWNFQVDNRVENWAAPDNWNLKYNNNNEAPDNWIEWINEIEEQIQADGGIYDYSYDGDRPGIENSTSVDEQSEHAMSIDKALYLTYKTYSECAEKYHCYSVAAPEKDDAGNIKDGQYKWGLSFMNFLAGGESCDFISIQNDISYLLAAGSYVEDYMGYQANEYDFDFINDASKLSLKVGDDVMEAVTIDENKYGFGKTNNGEYEYTLEYVKGNGQDEEHFIWNIYVPVSKFAPVQLTYSVKLTNPKTEAGIYGTYDADGSKGYDGLYTNNSAVLYPVDTNGEEGASEAFNQPTVSYTVAAADPAPVTPDKTPGGDGPQTSDDFNMLAVCAAALAALLAGTAAVTVRRKRQ